MNQLKTGELEFENQDEVSKYFGNLLLEGTRLQSTNQKNQNTYKDKIVELREVHYSIHSGRVLNVNPHHSPTMFWAISEGLSEILNLPRPIMERYSPEIMDKSYQISPDRMPIYSYGMRWKEFDQLNNIFHRLDENPTTKRAFLSIYNGLDTILGRSDSSCTIGHNFSIRDNKLDVAVHLRSWDFFAGQIYDTFLCGLLQRTFLSWLQKSKHPELELGDLHFYANSLHYYPSRNQQQLEEMLEFEKRPHQDFYHDVKPQQFNVDINQYFIDMYHLSDSEMAAYNGNFIYAIEKLQKIQDPLIRDFARVFLRKNLRRDKKEEIFNYQEFECEEMKEWSEVKRNNK